MEISESMTAVFDVMSEGILIIDKNAVILYANKAYCDFLKLHFFELKGQKLRDVRPGAMLPKVLEIKKPILHAPRQEIEDIYFVNMYPIFIEGEIAGGVSVVTFIQQAYDFKAMLEEVNRHNRQVINRISKASNAQYTFENIVAVSPLSVETKTLAQRAAATEATIFLQSESGTGKELYAQAIHNAGNRNGNIFLSVNCANFNAAILESELFGYVEGAFTGAKKGGKIGLFEAASKGTLFLDEISEMDLPLQAKLLRVLQEQRIRPVGAVAEKKVDVRIIAACNADLQKYMENGKFRPDLYYRLNVFPIQIPPLRDRQEDIAPLANAFLSELSKKFRRNISIEETALEQLCHYHWPGNVRELRNVLEFVSYLTDDGIIREDTLPESIRQGFAEKKTLSLRQRVKRFEKNEIQKLLRQNGYHMAGKQKTAEQLNISLASLYNKMGN